MENRHDFSRSFDHPQEKNPMESFLLVLESVSVDFRCVFNLLSLVVRYVMGLPRKNNLGMY